MEGAFVQFRAINGNFPLGSVFLRKLTIYCVGTRSIYVRCTLQKAVWHELWHCWECFLCGTSCHCWECFLCGTSYDIVGTVFPLGTTFERWVHHSALGTVGGHRAHCGSLGVTMAGGLKALCEKPWLKHVPFVERQGWTILNAQVDDHFSQWGGNPYPQESLVFGGY